MDARTLKWLLAFWLTLATLASAHAQPPGNLRIPPDPNDRRTLAISIFGAGLGVVTGPGITSCDGLAGGDCSEDYIVGTVVTIHATAASGSTFTGWSGACTGTGSCTVTMNQVQSVTATFTLATFQLTVTTQGVGLVTGSGINCGADCTESYPTDTIVTLTATPGTGFLLSGWSGACTGTQVTCIVTMSQARSVTAIFIPGWILAWNDNSSDETQFELERRTPCTTGTYGVIATPGPNVTQYTDTTVTGGVRYQYRIRAVNQFGGSTYSNELCTP